MLIIGYQHAPLVIRFLKQRNQLFQILCCCSLTNHDPLTARQLFFCFLQFRTLMIRSNASRHIGIQRFSGKSRRMPIHQFPALLRLRQFLDAVRLILNDPICIHHLRQSQYPFILIKRQQIFHMQFCAGFIQSRRRHTGWHHKIHIQKEILCCFQHIPDTGRPRHIRDLMGIRDYRAGSVRHYHPFKF